MHHPKAKEHQIPMWVLRAMRRTNAWTDQDRKEYLSTDDEVLGSRDDEISRLTYIIVFFLMIAIYVTLFWGKKFIAQAGLSPECAPSLLVVISLAFIPCGFFLQLWYMRVTRSRAMRWLRNAWHKTTSVEFIDDDRIIDAVLIGLAREVPSKGTVAAQRFYYSRDIAKLLGASPTYMRIRDYLSLAPTIGLA